MGLYARDLRPWFFVSVLVSLQSVDVLVNILGELNPVTVKVATQTFTTVYPLLFRHLCVAEHYYSFPSLN
jgi:Kef-type K+ transport system membrane component KefB